MRLFSALMLMVVLLSGCMEGGPGKIGGSGVEESVEEIKNLSIQSADSLSSYRLRTSVVQNMSFDALRINVTPEFHGMKGRIMMIAWNATEIQESTGATSSVNLTGHNASSKSTTTRIVEQESGPEERSIGRVDLYQIGNSTYVKRNNGNWTHLRSSRSSDAIWGVGRNSHVKTLAEAINGTQAEIIGMDKVEGADAYKLKVMAGSSDYGEMYNIAQASANWIMHYPELMPFIDHSAINRTAVVDKYVWISRESYLPVKYQRSISFRMTPEAVGALDSETGKMRLFNKSVQLGEVSVDLESIDLYYDFNKSVDIGLLADAL